MSRTTRPTTRASQAPPHTWRMPGWGSAPLIPTSRFSSITSTQTSCPSSKKSPAAEVCLRACVPGGARPTLAPPPWRSAETRLMATSVCPPSTARQWPISARSRACPSRRARWSASAARTRAAPTTRLSSPLALPTRPSRLPPRSSRHRPHRRRSSRRSRRRALQPGSKPRRAHPQYTYPLTRARIRAGDNSGCTPASVTMAGADEECPVRRYYLGAECSGRRCTWCGRKVAPPVAASS